MNTFKKKTTQDSPYPAPTKKYVKVAQDPIPKDSTNKLSKEEKKEVQQVTGSILYYATLVKITPHKALSTITAQQTRPKFEN